MQEQRLIREIEELQAELAPLEASRKQLAELAEKRSNNLIWLGLGMMSVQFGVLARLTWWEYSWDIMEPGKRYSLSRIIHLHLNDLIHCTSHGTDQS